MTSIKTNFSAASSQSFVPISEVKDGIIVLDDGTLVSISLVSSINIFLKSQEEQEAIVSSFKNFLNTLDFPVQIAIQSRALDIKPYLETLEKRLKEQTHEVIKLQTIEYIAFIKNFINAVNIMEKQFFLVISYKAAISETSENPLFSLLKKKKDDKKSTKMMFEESRNQLEQRVNLATVGLIKTGVKVKKLDTEASLELFYNIFNPGQGDLDKAIFKQN
ncbi:MAG: hypothetical protein LRZ98_01835 [Candidatus Pacebacteria bacterium]|nr:hypothetical protein [Candidatus Paceibacterota bacterium]